MSSLDLLTNRTVIINEGCFKLLSFGNLLHIIRKTIQYSYLNFTIVMKKIKWDFLFCVYIWLILIWGGIVNFMLKTSILTVIVPFFFINALFLMWKLILYDWHFFYFMFWWFSSIMQLAIMIITTNLANIIISYSSWLLKYIAYIYTMEDYSTIKGNKLLVYKTTWMNLKGIILS